MSVMNLNTISRVILINLYITSIFPICNIRRYFYRFKTVNSNTDCIIVTTLKDFLFRPYYIIRCIKMFWLSISI